MDLSRILRQLKHARNRRVSARSGSIACALKKKLARAASSRRMLAASEAGCESLELRLVLSASTPFIGEMAVTDAASGFSEEFEFPGEATGRVGSLSPIDQSCQVGISEEIIDWSHRIKPPDVLQTPESPQHDGSALDDWIVAGVDPPPIRDVPQRHIPDSERSADGNGEDPDSSQSTSPASSSQTNPAEDLPIVLVDAIFSESAVLNGLDNSGIADSFPEMSSTAILPKSAAFEISELSSADAGSPTSQTIQTIQHPEHVQDPSVLRFLSRTWTWVRSSSLREDSNLELLIAAGEKLPHSVPLQDLTHAAARPVANPAFASLELQANETQTADVVSQHDLAFGSFTSLHALPAAAPVPGEFTIRTSVEISTSSHQSAVRRLRESNRQCTGGETFSWIARSDEETAVQAETSSFPRELKYVVNPRAPPGYSRDPEVRIVVKEASADLLRRLRYSIAPRGPSLVIVETQSPELSFSSGPRVSPEFRSGDSVG